MQNLPADTFGPQPFDRHRVTIDWWQAGCQWQEADDGSVTWCTVWDPTRFADEFGAIDYRNVRVVAQAIETHDVPTMVHDQSMAVWEEECRQEHEDGRIEQAIDDAEGF